ncbi:MAG: hypothetical protein JW807_09325 [Spirochaetes bacterium]|nr:hypothetical protein [Spirochaetota bacterium]
MKKRIAFLTIILPVIAINLSYGFVESRLQWWEIRLRKLAAEKASLQKKSDIDRRVLRLIDSEMKRGRELISVFENDMRDDGSLTHETRVMTESDIMAQARKTVPSLRAIRQMEILVDGIGSNAGVQAAREIVKSHICSMISRTLGAESEALADRIMAESITRDEWKNLAAELLIGGMMAGRIRMDNEAVCAVAEKIAGTLKEKNNTTNGRALRFMSARTALEYLECLGGECPPDRVADVLDASWSWRELRRSIEKELSSCRKIITLMDDASGLPLERVRELYKKPADLDSILFKSRHSRYLNDASPVKTEGNMISGATVMEIPAVPGNIPALEEIDRIRRPAMLSLTGREDRKFFDDLNKKFAAVIKRHTEETKSLFFREEERVRLLREKEGDRIAVVNEEEFRETEKRFADGIALLENYREKSLDAVALLSEGKRMSADAIVEDYRYRLQRNREYLGFAVALTEESSRVSSIEQPRAHIKLSAAMGKIGSIFRHVGTTLSIDRQHLPFLSRQDIITIRRLKADFTGTMYSLRSDMRNCFARYVREHSAAEGAGAQAREGLQEKIAQDEIYAHLSHARECVDLYGQFTYGADALERYADAFNALLKEARSGAVSPGLEYAIKMYTLIPSIKDFNADLLRIERTTKSYLRNETKSALARLVYLLQYYRKNRIDIGDPPTQDELASLEASISSYPSVKIGSWTMNETNFSEIDKKAVKKLSLSVKRASLVVHADTGTETVPDHNATSVSLREPGLSLDIPMGWKEDAVTEIESYLGVVKSFSNGTIDSSIRLITLPLEDGDAKAAAEAWMEKSGCTPVGKKWDSANGLQYIRIHGRDRSKNIVETCALSLDGVAVLISGKTSKARYAVFRAQFNRIIGSVQSGGM